MNANQIDNEVCKYLSALEAMEADGIITKEERQKLRTKVKAWAYDRIQELAVEGEKNTHE